MGEDKIADFDLPISNQPEDRKIQVKKLWKDANNSTLSDENIPVDGDLVVKIYSSTVSSSYDKNSTPVATVKLNRGNNWTSDELSLPVVDSNNKNLFYFAEEEFSDENLSLIHI